MNQAPSGLSQRTAPAIPSCTLNTLLRAGLGAALLALTAACSDDMLAGQEGFDAELEDPNSELLETLDSADELEETGVVDKATFSDTATYNGFNVGCTADQKARIEEAQARAAQILSIAGPANASARVNRTTAKASAFKTIFVPNGNTNPDPNRGSPDAWDVASLSVAQKSVKLSQVLASALHTCHGGNESHNIVNGVFNTCNQSGANASTNGSAGTPNTIRWCDGGLAQTVNARAVTLLHELTHQDRTNDATNGHVFDDNRNGEVYNAHNYSRWFNNNLP